MTGGYKGLKEVTRGFKRLQEVKKGLQEVAGGYKRLQKVSRH